jgi:hypothetical protein
LEKEQFMNDRRGFLRLLTLGGLVTGGILDGQEGHGQTRTRNFSGTSKKGDFAEALNKAIAAAERSVRHPDAMVSWTLKKISGRSGGIAGFSEVSVSIEALVS